MLPGGCSRENNSRSRNSMSDENTKGRNLEVVPSRLVLSVRNAREISRMKAETQ